MWDDNGRVTIPGFYDGVKELPADIKADLKGLDLTPEKFLGAHRPERCRRAKRTAC